MISRSPVFLEIIGTPAAGKTTLAGRLNHFFNSSGISCAIADEPSARYPGDPSDKLKPIFNIWTLHQAIDSIEFYRANRDVEVIIFDRGIVDSFYWLSWFKKSAGFVEHEYKSYVRECRFHLSLINNIISLTCSYDEAENRRPGGGRIMNRHIYPQLLNNYKKNNIVEELGLGGSSYFQLDTSDIQVDTVESRVRAFLDAPRNGSREEVLAALVKVKKNTGYSK